MMIRVNEVAARRIEGANVNVAMRIAILIA